MYCSDNSELQELAVVHQSKEIKIPFHTDSRSCIKPSFTITATRLCCYVTSLSTYALYFRVKSFHYALYEDRLRDLLYHAIVCIHKFYRSSRSSVINFLSQPASKEEWEVIQRTLLLFFGGGGRLFFQREFRNGMWLQTLLIRTCVFVVCKLPYSL